MMGGRAWHPLRLKRERDPQVTCQRLGRNAEKTNAQLQEVMVVMEFERIRHGRGKTQNLVLAAEGRLRQRRIQLCDGRMASCERRWRGRQERREGDGA